jgi:hypothetical protein
LKNTDPVLLGLLDLIQPTLLQVYPEAVLGLIAVGRGASGHDANIMGRHAAEIRAGDLRNQGRRETLMSTKQDYHLQKLGHLFHPD